MTSLLRLSPFAATTHFAMPTREALAFHQSLPGYQPTPLHRAPALAQVLGVAQVFIKDESQRLGLPSFKVLGASWATWRALCEHLGRPVGPWPGKEQLAAHGPLSLSLAAATDGNHGRAVAFVARLFGLGARIFVPAGTAAARIRAIEQEGATVTVVEGGYDDAVEAAAAQGSAHCFVISDTSWPGYERIPQWVIEGYSTLFWEIDDALRAQGETPVDTVVVPMGVGALAAAAVRHFRAGNTGLETRLLGVEPVDAACVMASLRAGALTTLQTPQRSIMAGLNCGTPASVAWAELQGGLSCTLTTEDATARQAMRALSRLGLEAGETGAASLAGALTASTLCQRCTCLCASQRVLLLMTEGPTDEAAFHSVLNETD